MKMMGHIVPVRSQYAVVLAYFGTFGDAEAEMVRLNPYESGLNDSGRIELQEQRGLIAQLKRRAPAPQWQFRMPPGKYPCKFPLSVWFGQEVQKVPRKPSQMT
jgi:hypothetical protein